MQGNSYFHQLAPPISSTPTDCSCSCLSGALGSLNKPLLCYLGARIAFVQHRLIMSIFASAILVTGIRGDVSSATTGSDMFLKVLPKVLNTWGNYSMHSIAYRDTNGNGISIIFDNGFGPFLLVIAVYLLSTRV